MPTSGRVVNGQRGFTLIELMAVVAIIAILCGFALPQFQTNQAKAQVARAMSEASMLRNAVELCLNAGLTTIGVDPLCNPGAAPSNLLIGSAQVSTTNVPAGTGVPQVALSAAPTGSGTQIVAFFGNRASSALAGMSVTWSRDAASGSWTCASTAPQRFMPQSCTGT